MKRLEDYEDNPMAEGWLGYKKPMHAMLDDLAEKIEELEKKLNDKNA